jgi:hypothetical protein
LLSLVNTVAAQRSARAAGPAAHCDQAHYVTLAAGGSFEHALLSEVQKDLETELAPRGFCVLSERVAEREPSAEITLSQRDTALVSIQVDDHTTGKRVARDVSLSKIPSSGAALAVAIATDELLRASWAELMLRSRAEASADSAPQQAPVAPAVPTQPEPSPRVAPEAAPSPPSRFGLGLFGDYSHNAQNWDAFALGLRLSLRPVRFLLLEVGAGAQSALDVKTEFGTARAHGLTGLLSAAGCADVLPVLSLCGGARFSLWWIQFRGTQPHDAKPLKEAVTSVLLAALVQLRWSVLPRLALVGEASLGGALRGAQAVADGQTLLGNAGMVVTGALGLEVAL